VDFASVKGGLAPVDPSSIDLKDAVNKQFWEGEGKSLTENTKKASKIYPNDYDAVFYAGGHGVMWDFPTNPDLWNISETIWNNGGVVAAVCHGPAGLVNLKDKNGEYIIQGRQVAGFTNEEEEAVGMTKVVPFLLEDALKKQGGVYSKAANWESYVKVDGKLITGQNPASAAAVGEEIAKLLR
ncbi:unnamed protein product, partial [Didymodactylos carnosus]